MRRNNMRGPRFGPPARPNVGGPLMTEHLTIQNLERELDNLRRKREAIQHQQHVLMGNNEHERKRQFQHREPSNRNLPNMYGNIWEASPPKRFNAPPRGNPWRDAGPDFSRPFMPNQMSSDFNSPHFNKNIEIPRPHVPLIYQGPLLSTPKPLVHPKLNQSIGQRIHNRQAPPAVRKDFNPTKITKNRPQAPNKLNSYPLPERKNLVQNATLPQEDNNARAAKKATVLILREDQIPSKQVTGRLELALGHIIKEIRENNNENQNFATISMNPGYNRTMKQAIRERLRSVMLNQPVGSVVEILEKYRAKFPKETDKEIVDLVINAGKNPVNVPVVEADDPEEFFKTNISKIIEKKMTEMFSNLVKMYTKAHRNATLAYTQAAIDANQVDTEFELEYPVCQSVNAMKTLKNLSGKIITVKEQAVLKKYYTELIQSILEEKMLETLPKCMKYCVKIFDLDHHYRAVKFMATKRVRDSLKEKKTAARNSMVQKKNNESEQDNATDNNDLLEESVTENTTAKETTSDQIHTLEIEDNEECEKKEEEIEPNKKDVEATSEQIIVPTTPLPNKVEAVEAKLVSSDILKTPTTPTTPLLKELPYYVKLIGRPNLPTRAVIYSFLNSYHPASIKKHKSINNLLVVGFVNQEDYDKILLANETIIGDITIIIKASEKINPGKENDMIKENESINENKCEEVEEEEDNRETKSALCDVLPNKCKSNDDLKPELSIDNGKETLPEYADTKVSPEFTTEDKSKIKFEKITEADEHDHSQDTEQPNKEPKVDLRETGRSTPVRAARLANVTPSTIRTRRASRLMQE